jgi:predicted DNA-binding transcriptional regulator AlpA
MDKREIYLSSRQVKERYGQASDMWLWRREHEEPREFPKPLRILGRKFWRLADLEAYESTVDQSIHLTHYNRNFKKTG